MKKLIVLLAMIITSSVYAADDVTININNEIFTAENAPVIQNDRVLVPMRAIFEKLKASVSWDEASRVVSASTKNNFVRLQIDNNWIVTLGGKIELDTAPVIIEDRTYVPLRAVSDSLGAKVEWDAITRTVNIDYNIHEEKTIPIVIEMQDGGVMSAELYPETAPITVENFVKLINGGFYDGLIFHRVIEGFMIQGGGYDKNFNEKKTESIVGEFSSNGHENDLKHMRGVLSMARTNIPDSATSQFFIMHDDAFYLDGQYAAFGRLTDGFDVLDKIAAVSTTSLSNGMADVPVEPQIIKTIRIDE